jgi:hypothetical protein
LERSNGLDAARIGAVREALTRAERAQGDARRGALTTLAAELDGDRAGSADAARVDALATSVRELATLR